MSNVFDGFSPETLRFLTQLGENNNKPWFDAHRREYEEFVLSPMRNLVEELAPFMLSVDSNFNVTPAVNKTISRIYRDTRFSRDKSPFRNNMWIVFKRPGKEWQDAPGYFFEIFPDWFRYGMGYYCAKPATMSKFRDAIDNNVYRFLDVISFFNESDIFELHGEDYKKVFVEDQSDAVRRWYQKKNFYISHDSKEIDRLFSPDLTRNIIEHFKMTVPFYQYLRKVHSG